MCVHERSCLRDLRITFNAHPEVRASVDFDVQQVLHVPPGLTQAVTGGDIVMHGEPLARPAVAVNIKTGL